MKKEWDNWGVDINLSLNLKQKTRKKAFKKKAKKKKIKKRKKKLGKFLTFTLIANLGFAILEIKN